MNTWYTWGTGFSAGDVQVDVRFSTRTFRCTARIDYARPSSLPLRGSPLPSACSLPKQHDHPHRGHRRARFWGNGMSGGTPVRGELRRRADGQMVSGFSETGIVVLGERYQVAKVHVAVEREFAVWPARNLTKAAAIVLRHRRVICPPSD